MTNSNLVYSTDKGRMCPECNKMIAQCTCSQKKQVDAPAGNGQVRVSLQTKGRKGKGVTIITGLPLNSHERESLAKELKRKLGTGGTVCGADIEIQGDRRDILVEELIKRGFKAKRSGG